MRGHAGAYMNLPAGIFRFRVTACAPFVPAMTWERGGLSSR
jgi:hypothetical protein